MLDIAARESHLAQPHEQTRIADQNSRVRRLCAARGGLVKSMISGVLLILPYLMGAREPSLLAQSTAPQPAVTRRNLALTGGVWPGDFNRDGVTDLVAGNQVMLGNGDGTFKPPQTIAYDGAVVATGDFNRDGMLDVVAAQNVRNNPEVAILLGKGDGTFGVQWHVTNAIDRPFVLVADLDGDLFRDLVIGSDEDPITVVPNRGTGTFIERVTLPSGLSPHDGVIADVNGDGKRDILIANHYESTVSVYVNQGAFTFTKRDATVGYQANDVTAADLNGAAPGWVRLSRPGSTIAANWSRDRVNWTTSTVQVSMASRVYIGVAVTSHNPSATITAVFDDIILVR
jgi:hypothetical protein